MARYTFGGRSGDFGISDPATTGGAMTAAISQTGGTVWTAQTGGTQITDLLVSGSPVTTISTDSHGRLVPFQGPDGYNSAAWVTFGGAPRTMVDPQGPFSLQSDAVPLSIATPSVDTSAGSAGTALTAARGDHQHPATITLGQPVFGASTINGSLFMYHTPLGSTNSIAVVTNLKGPLTPLPIYRRQTIKELNVKVGTAGDASAQIAFTIYAVNANGVPTGSVYTSSYIAATSTGIKTWSSLSITLERGLYYMAMGAKGFTSTRPRCYVPDRSTIWQLWTPTAAGGPSGVDAVPGMTVKTVNETTGVFPSSLAAGTDIDYSNNDVSAWFYAYLADAA